MSDSIMIIEDKIKLNNLRVVIFIVVTRGKSFELRPLSRLFYVLTRFHLRQGGHDGPDGDCALHENRDFPAVVRKPDEDLSLVHEDPLVLGKGPDLDRSEFSGRSRHLFPAHSLDLNGPVLAAVVNLYDNRLADDEVIPRPEIV